VLSRSAREISRSVAFFLAASVTFELRLTLARAQDDCAIDSKGNLSGWRDSSKSHGRKITFKDADRCKKIRMWRIKKDCANFFER